MSAAPSTSMNTRRETCIPPRRGKIKARIFKRFCKAIASAASKAFGGSREDGNDSTIPPSSAYNSDANFDLS